VQRIVTAYEQPQGASSQTIRRPDRT
jgi:hypothetical protein